MAASSKARNQQVHILILEGDSDKRRRFVELLQSLPDVESARTVRSDDHFIATCRTPGQFSMAIVGGSGETPADEVIRKLRAELGDLCPPIICSLKVSKTNGAGVSSAFEAGASAFLVEPHSAASIGSAIEQVRSSDAFRHFQERSAAAIVRITFGFASKLIDDAAEQQIAKNPPSPDMLRDWKNLRTSIAAVSSRVSTDEFVAQLEKELAHAKPFALREGAKTVTRARVVKAAEVVKKLLAKRGIALSKLQELVRIDPTELESFLNGQSSMTPHIATELARALGHDKEYWMCYK